MRFRLVSLLLFAATAAVAAEGETGRQLLERRKALDDGERRWVDRQGLVTITVRDAEAFEDVREVVVYQRRFPDGERRTVAFVRALADSAKTGFLQISRAGAPSEQWLCEQTAAAPRKLGAEAQNGRIVGTELTFHDLDVLDHLLGWPEADVRTSLRGQEAVEGVAAHAIELWPKRADVGYRKIVVWLGRDDLVTREVQLFGERDVALKRVRITRVRDEGSVPWPERIEIDSPARKGLATVEVSKVVFNRKLDPALFEPAALARGAP